MGCGAGREEDACTANTDPEGGRGGRVLSAPFRFGTHRPALCEGPAVICYAATPQGGGGGASPEP